MIQTIGLIVAVYALCRLVQVPLSIPRNRERDGDRLASWVVCLIGVCLVGFLTIGLLLQGINLPQQSQFR